MSESSIRTLLRILAQPAWSSNKRLTALNRAFQTLETLVNPKNVSVIINELLVSQLWQDGSASDVTYDCIAASRYLSAQVSTSRHRDVLRAIKASSAESWKKAALVAAFSTAEMRNEDQNASWLSFKSNYGRSLVTYTNAACIDGTINAEISAALLVAMSYCWAKLSSYQQARIRSAVPVELARGLYQSNLVLSPGSFKASHKFGDLGVLSRTLASITELSRGMNHQEAASISLNVAQGVAPKASSQDIIKPLFLSLMVEQQSVLVSAIRSRCGREALNKLANITLQLLFALQHVHPDNSVYEPWRFCFNCSLDILNNDEKELAAYLNDLLDRSVLSKNPLTTLTNDLYSARQDNAQLDWLLLVIEASAANIKSPETLERVYDFCFDALKQNLGKSQQRTELLHSVLLCLHTSHPQDFSRRALEYVKFVLVNSQGITERQWLVIFTTMYRLSLAEQALDEAEDSLGILGSVKAALQRARDDETQSKLVKTLIEILPIIPAPYLAQNLRHVDTCLKQAANRAELETRFVETCTTAMSSEKAQICTRFLLRRTPDIQERARL